MLAWRALGESVGVELTSHSADEMAELAELAELAAAPRSSDAAAQAMQELGALLRAHSLVVFRGGGGGGARRLASPARLRALYTAAHSAMGMACVPPQAAPPAHAPPNLRGAFFPGFPETNILGASPDVRDWHGLTGYIEPTPWWEKASCQFHHDGGFSSTSPPPPALVAMGCERTPGRGGGVLHSTDWGDRGAGGAQLRFAPGATLFYSTKLAVRLAADRTPALLLRARRLACVYRAGFGNVVEGEYPRMRPSALVPRAPPASRNKPAAAAATATAAATAQGGTGAGAAPPGARSVTDMGFRSLEHYAFGNSCGGEPPSSSSSSSSSPSPASALYRSAGAAQGAAGQGMREFRHALIQTDGATGEEYAMVHALCLEYLEEEGEGGGEEGARALGWAESMELIEALLAPACRPPHILAMDWRPGDVVLFDNRSVQHSVTPTHQNGDELCYAALGEERLLTRTAMQPSWVPSQPRTSQPPKPKL